MSLNKLHEAGYEVHVNFSPIVIHDSYKVWSKKWNDLLSYLKENISESLMDEIMFECIFLTHNEKLHERNKNIPEESLLWKPKIQEPKVSKMGGKNIRYKFQDKRTLIEVFTEIVSQHFDKDKIRYIF